MHVVHAPNFPHAAVADVNVHCIRPASIKSLAVAFLRGDGGELPGMGNPIEDMYEVRETPVAILAPRWPFDRALLTWKEGDQVVRLVARARVLASKREAGKGS